MNNKKIIGITKNFKIRGNDPHGLGSGAFGVSRGGGTRKHSGIDIVVRENEPIYAPFDMIFNRVAIPYANDNIYRGAEYLTDFGTVKIFYFQPLTTKRNFLKGDVIGYAQDISKKYDPRMTTHIHFEMRDQKGNLLNPENYV